MAAPAICRPLVSFFQYTLLIFLILLLLATVVPFLLLPLALYRLTVIGASKCLRPDLTHIVRGGDAFVLPSSPPHTTTHQNIIITSRLDSPLDFDSVKQLILERFVQVRDKNGKVANPELQEYYTKWGGYIFWTPEVQPFAIDRHVRLRVLQPGEKADRVQIEYLAEPYAEGTSPWGVLVLVQEAEGATEGYQILFKWHHGFADGYSAVRAWMRVMDEPAVFLEHPPPPVTCIDVLAYPFRLLQALHHMIAMPLAASLPWPRMPPEPLAGNRRHNTANQPTQVVSMELIKGIARRQGVTVNAVVQAGVTGALRAFLVAKYRAESVPPWVRYQVPIPVHVHPPGLCNAIRAVSYTLPVGEPSALARLQSCEGMLAECKGWALGSMEGHIMYYLTQPMGVIPKCWPFAGLENVPFSIQIYTTNLPGPRKPVRLAGQEVSGMNIQMDAPGSTTYFLFFSYVDQLAHVWMGDDRVFTLEDMQDLAGLFQKEFQELDSLEPDSCK